MTNLVTIALTHVATQITGKWLDAPDMLAIEPSTELNLISSKCASDGLASISEAEWLEFLKSEIYSHDPILAWLAPLCKSERITLNQLAESTFQHFDAVLKNGAENVFIGSDSYPTLLQHITRPPLCLTVLGNQELLTLRHVAIIGSRKASYEALRMSVELGAALTGCNVGVVSGGAIGCDIAVHEGMLATTVEQINAIVVFAGGLSSLFPRCNARTFRDILSRGGAFVSERLWHQGVRPRDFPARNRIVSGMSESVAVMAAAERSGSLITAQEALEQGRDVYVFLPRYFDQDIRIKGSVNLLADGAYSFSQPHELVENLISTGDQLFSSPLALARETCQAVRTIGTFERELL